MHFLFVWTNGACGFRLQVGEAPRLQEASEPRQLKEVATEFEVSLLD